MGRNNPPVKEISGVTNSDVNISSDLIIYPNPFTEQFNMDISAAEESTCAWSVYDMTGRLVLNRNEAIHKGDNLLNVEASTLTKGVYMLNAIINNEKHSFRIVKQ